MTVGSNGFEISPETIKQELQPVVYEQRQTDIF